MAAVINQLPSSSTSSLGVNAKIDLIQKVDGQGGRLTGIHLLSKQDDDGFVTINEDRTLRVLLKRDSGQFWPSIIQDLPNVPTALYLTGILMEYNCESDFNSLSLKRQWGAHASGVTGLIFSALVQQIFSCGKDRNLIWHCADSSNKIGNYVIDAPCTTMEFDAASKFIFLGDNSGSVYVLRLVGTSVQLVSKLSAHTSLISSLAWDFKRQLLFSSSTDSLVIMWDIGGKRVTRLSLAINAQRLFSVDENGHLMCWDLKAHRIVAPAWRDSDKCELCDVPFFWNFKVMWDRKVVGVRRHHCRTCGQSVCLNCCNYKTIFPAMGFEKPARICKTCHTKMEKYPEQFE